MDKNELDKAIGAHGMWKARLKQAIATGKVDTPTDTIRKDNECAFGKWLHGSSLNTEEKNTPEYKKVRDLHAHFHKCAARVAELAQNGKKDLAEQMLSVDGEFGEASHKLTQAMMDWKRQPA